MPKSHKGAVMRVNWPLDDGQQIPGVDPNDIAKMVESLASRGVHGPYTLFVAGNSKPPRRKPIRDHHSIPEGET